MSPIDKNLYPEVFVESFPEVLYKYRDWKNDNHKRIITNNELFFSSPEHFNDIFDCNIPIATYLLKDNEALQRAFARKVISNNYSRINKAITVPELDVEISNALKLGRLNDDNLIQKNMNETISDMRKHSGILSLTPHKNNILMWSHYSNSHRGFCIGFKRDYFLKLDFGFMGKVQYPPEFPIISPLSENDERIVKQIFYKSHVWSYEDEFRIYHFGKSNFIIEFNESDVHEIILGASMPKKDIDMFMSIIKDKFKHVPVWKAIPKKNLFEIDFERIG